jgi:outer membrane protein assembly factor BamA
MGKSTAHKYLLFLFLVLNLGAANAQDKGKLEKLIDKAYSIVEGDSAKPKSNYFLIIPMWGIAPETGLKLGVSVGFVFRMAVDSITRPSMAKINTSFTTNRQFNFRPFCDLFFKENKYNLKAQYVFNDFNENYWGIGNQATEADKELYDFNQHKLNARLTKQIIHNLYFGGQFMYEKLYKTQFEADSKTPQSAVSGINGYEVFGAGLALAFDNRDNIYYPSKGAYLEISNHFYSKSIVGNHSFNSVIIDLRKYFPLWGSQIFALQGVASLNEGDVPFRQMGTLGSENYMRGYYNGRFRDNHMVAMQGEFRFKIWGPLGATLFGGAGNVGHDFNDLNYNIKPNYGFGLRGLVLRKEKINARMDIGFGEKGINGFYFTLFEAF